MARAVSTRRTVFFTIVAWVIALVIFFPILYTIITSFKSETEAIQGFNLIPSGTVESYAAVQAMGEDEADTLAMAPRPDKLTEAATAAGKVEVAGAAKSAFDRTHLGAKGAAYFSRMVMDEIKRAIPDLAGQFKPESEQ